ncbi:hypothetical protein D3C73_850720 [compost metagenome]
MAIAEGAVLQQVMAQEDLVQLAGDIAAAHARAHQLEPCLVHFDVGLPQAQMLVRAVAQEQRTLQCGVVAGDHREAVEAENVARVYLAAGHRVVRTVSVEPGLEPGPGVHQLAVGETAGDLADHRLGGMQCHFIFRHLVLQRLHHRRTANVGHPRTVANERLFFGGLDHAHAHAGRTDVQQLGPWVAGSELGMVLQVEVVVLHADTRRQR